MNINIFTWIEYFVGAFICCFSCFLSGKILLNKKFKEIKVYSYGLLLIFSILTIFNTLTFDNIVKIVGTLLIFFLILSFIFNKRNTESFIYSIFIYIIFIISEISLAILISLLSYFLKLNLNYLAYESIYTNLIIGFFSVILSIILKNKISILVDKLKKSNIVIFLLEGVLTIFIAISCINHLYIENWKLSYNFILNSIIVVGSLFLMYSLLKQFLKNKEVVDKYQLLEEYLKTSAELIEKYSTTNHKYKNNLISIKGYMESNLSEAKSFVDGLLDNYKNEKYNWFSKINYIKFDSIRYLVYYKLSKAEEENIKILVFVDKNIQTINNNLMSINQSSVVLDILGEFFDNAIYASNESKEKEMIFNIYLENNEIVFELDNTYLNEINLSLITKNGYTTKGKGHGFGLYEIDKNIKNYSFLNYKYEIVDNYFITKLYVSLNALTKERNKRISKVK